MDRPKLFQDDDLGLDRFEPRSDPAPVPPNTVRRIADAGGFPSREASPSPVREPLTYRSGRTATLTIKTTPSTQAAFYAAARAQGWKVGETFEHAVELLTKSLAR